MRTLSSVTPTPEQLAIFSRTTPGVMLIRGAAGSGKTTTALLRLRALTRFFANRKRRTDDTVPVYVLVLTFNRTLRGYIEVLTRQQAFETQGIEMEISTFSRWAMRVLGRPRLVQDAQRRALLKSYGQNLGLQDDFLLDEVDYVLGRFLPDSLQNYVTVRRDGRGASPRVDRALRERILDEVIAPYSDWKKTNRLLDWNDLAVSLTEASVDPKYDIIIADETQDFSANQIRALQNQLATEHSLTFVLDSAQRIYARGFTWQEAGVTVRPENIKRLNRNYRNTVEIAQFAKAMLQGLPIDDDGTLPNFDACERHGPTPIVLRGRFGPQADYVIEYIKTRVDLANESVAFLHPLGGNWFYHLQRSLEHAGLAYVEITRESEWPEGYQNIALSTLSSAKGLEFDHVVILGLNAEVTPHGLDDDDDRLTRLRRLLAMGIGRARLSVILGYKPTEKSKLVEYLDPETYEVVEV
jgi:superfamily I DNA/RNA helicase